MSDNDIKSEAYAQARKLGELYDRYGVPTDDCVPIWDGRFICHLITANNPFEFAPKLFTDGKSNYWDIRNAEKMRSLLAIRIEIEGVNRGMVWRLTWKNTIGPEQNYNVNIMISKDDMLNKRG